MSAIAALRFGARTAGWALLGATATLLLAATVPLALGHGSFSVMSGSMAPAVDAGDVVVAERIAPRQASVGDVVTFRDPQGTGRLISHRVRSLRVDGNTVHATTKGDANNTAERWSAPAGGEIGRVSYRLPKLGYVMVWTRTPLGRLLLIALPLLGLGAWTLVRIWRPRGEELPGDAAA